MPNILKRIGQVLENRKNVHFEDLEIILLFFGYTKSQPRSGSSHFSFRKKGSCPITIPMKRPHIGEIYVSKVIEMIGLEEWYDENK